MLQTFEQSMSRGELLRFFARSLPVSLSDKYIYIFKKIFFPSPKGGYDLVLKILLNFSYLHA